LYGFKQRFKLEYVKDIWHRLDREKQKDTINPDSKTDGIRKYNYVFNQP